MNYTFVISLQVGLGQNYDVSDISCSNEGMGGKQLLAARLRYAKYSRKDDI